MSQNIPLNLRAGNMTEFLIAAHAAQESLDDAEEAYLLAEQAADDYHDRLEMRAAVLLLETDEDGKPIINGSSEDKRKAQLKATLKDEYEHWYDLKDFASGKEIAFKRAARRASFFRLIIDAHNAAKAD